MKRDTDNPAGICPACGGQTYGWAVSKPRPGYAPGGELVIDRCESCGTGVQRGATGEDLERELAGASRLGLPNRGSLQAALGAGGWASLSAEHKVYPTPAGLERFADANAGTPLRPGGIAQMWQTLINGFTLRDNVLRDFRAGRQRPQTGRERAATALDLLVSTLVAIPLLAIALILESIGALTGHGGYVTGTGVALTGNPAAQARTDGQGNAGPR